MIALSFPQPHATLIASGQQTVATYPDDDRTTVLTLLGIVGQTVAIAATDKWNNDEPFDQWDGHPADYPSNAIVGSARIGAVVPIPGNTEYEVYQWLSGADDVRYHADFTPGRWAVLFGDAVDCCCDLPGSEPECGAPIPYISEGPTGEWTL